MPTSSRLWSGIIEKLRGSYTCLAVDLPGLGRSPKIPYGPNQLEVLAEQIEQLRAEHNIEKWHVVGHDAGSAVAVHYAYRFPNRVDHLVLLSPAMFPELKPFHLFRLLRLPVIGELLAPLVNLIFWNVAMRYALPDKRAADMNDAIADFSAPFSGLFGSWRLMSVLRWGNPEEVLSAIPAMLPQLRVPTLIFHGSHDAAVPQAFAVRASALIARSRLIMVDAGHFIALTNPGVVASHLHDFFGVAGNA
jgi:pimeloyl-ACP methyl ester carboxylesterase